jgi:hypothetical protein
MIRPNTLDETRRRIADMERLSHGRSDGPTVGLCWYLLGQESLQATGGKHGTEDEAVRGVRTPSREFHVDAAKVKEIRAITGLSQPKFAKLLHVDVGTLRNGSKVGENRPGLRRRS